MLRTLGVVLCLTAAMGASPAAAADRLTRVTLDDALDLASRESPLLRAKEYEYRSVQANETTAALRPNPIASYLVEQLPGGSDALVQHTLSIGQPIEMGGKRQRRIDSSRAATRVTGHELADLRRQVVFQVKKTFTAVLQAGATLALAEQNLKTLDEVERIQRLRAEKGDISELELLRIQVQRFAFERDAADARQAIRAAKIALRTFAGADRIADDYDVVGELTVRDVPSDAVDWRRLALETRPDLQATEAFREKAQADVNLARANAWWDITPQLEYQRIGNDNTIGFGFSIPLRVFDRNQGEIERTQAEVHRAGALREQARLQALSEVDAAVASLDSQRRKLTILRDTYLPKARRARDTVDFAYRRGGLSLLDFLDAQRTYRETALEELQALGNYQAAVYQLEAAVGGSLTKP